MSKTAEAIRKLFQLRVFLIVNVAVLIFLLLSFGRQWVRNASIESEIADLSAQKETLEARNNELLSLGQTIQTQYYLEKEGRLKYGLSKPGEQLVVVTDKTTAQPVATDPNAPASTSTDMQAVDEAAPARLGNPRRWWAYFFNSVAYQEMKKEYGS